MKSLVLAEKPSVARDIARVLGADRKHKSHFEGPEYVVTWALGHLVGLAEPEDYDPKYRTWNLEDLPILPPEPMKLVVLKETSHQFREIEKLARRPDIGELIIATDAGREGELVARWIMEKVKWRKPFKRLWISSQTDRAIRDGFRALRPGHRYDDLYASAVCRAEADWLIGLNVTRALTVKYNEQLAAGRVQTPTLSMLIEREKAIESFRSTPYWMVRADFGEFAAYWREHPQHAGRLADRDAAEALRRLLAGKTVRVRALRRTEKTEPQPLPYDMTELQRDANRRLGFSAKQTAAVLQRLYEQHKLVTYPRTDSRYLPSDIVPTFPDRLRAVAVGPYAPFVKPLIGRKPDIARRVVDDGKVTDHHAIIPTEEPVNLAALNADERKLYDLITRRFIALFYPVHRYEEVAVTLEAERGCFTVKGRVEKQAGWKEVYGGGSVYDEPESDEAEQEETEEPGVRRLPELREGQTLTIRSVGVEENYTTPPKRYTEAALLTEMEKHRLGTPATRADIIEKLLSTETIERQGNRLVPTAKGRQLIELVAAELRSPELTAEWEVELEQIALGRGDRKAFMAGIREFAARLVRDVKNSRAEYKPHNLTHSHCPTCGERLAERKSKRGKMLVCVNRACGYSRPAEPILLNKRCPQCRRKMELHEGKAGKYAQCRPCNVIEMLDDERQGRLNKRAERELLRKYAGSAGFGNSLGEALKAALERQDGEA
jgi:DNA topoisomerase-3